MNLRIEPSYRTASLAGLWSALGLALFYFWLENAVAASPLFHNLAWFVVLGVFIYLPGYFLVVGRTATRFSRNWLSSPMERQRYLAAIKRIALWLSLAAAGITVASWLRTA